MNEPTLDLLEKPNSIRKAVRAQKYIIEEIRVQALPKAITYDRPHVQGAIQGDYMERWISNLQDAEEKLRRLVRAYRQAEGRLLDVLGELLEDGEITADEAELVKLHYLKRISFSRIAQRFGMSEASIYRIRRSAIEAIEAYLDAHPQGSDEKRPGGP